MERFTIAQKLAPTPTNEPSFSIKIKNSSGQEVSLADPKATRALVALMDMAAVIGGAASHYGGPAAFAELMSALHGFSFSKSKESGKPWHQLFHIVNDAGHCENGLYALKANYKYADMSLDTLKGFRSIDSKLTGHGEVHLFPEGVFVSNGPLGSGLPQAQGLAFADQLAKKMDRVTVTAISDGGCMEGEAKEAFAAIPGLAAKGQMAPFICIVSDNNTKLSGRIDQEAFSMEGTFKSLAALGWKVVELADGHDLEKCYHTIEAAYQEVINNPKVPVVIHARTIKGKGTKATEESSSGAHGFPLKTAKDLEAFVTEIYQGESVPSEMTTWISELVDLESKKVKGPSPEIPHEKIQVGVANALIDMREKGFPVISVTSDLPGSTGVAGFRKKFPEASLDVGVAESNMVSTGIGLSKAGYIPIVDTFSQFGVTKGSLPLIMSNLSEGPVIAVFSHTGFQDAADGASHQALSYFAMVSAIPKVDVYCLTSSSEAYALVTQSIEYFAEKRKAGEVPHSQVFFLGRENFARTYIGENPSYELGKAQVVIDRSADYSESVTIAAAGSLLPQAIKASEQLATMNIGSVVVNPSSINRPDVDCFKAALKKTKNRLITVEDHRAIAGMGAMLVHKLSNEGCQVKCMSLGVSDQFGQSSYTAIGLYEKHGLDSESITRTAKVLLEK